MNQHDQASRGPINSEALALVVEFETRVIRFPSNATIVDQARIHWKWRAGRGTLLGGFAAGSASPVTALMGVAARDSGVTPSLPLKQAPK